MKKFNVSIRVLALTLLIGELSSCSDRDNLLDENVTAEKEISFAGINEQGFSSNISSRTGESASITPVADLNKFFEDKLICMYVDKVNADGSVVPYYDRKYLTVKDGNLVMPEKLYYPSDNSPVNIYVVAATPYSSARIEASPVKPEVFWQYCQVWQPNSNSDFLYANVKNVDASSGPLSLDFRHLGTKISVAVVSPDNSKLTRLCVLNALFQSVYNMDDGTYIINNPSMNFSMEPTCTDALNTSFDGEINYASVYVAPQVIEAYTEFILFVYDGKEYYYSLPEKYTFISEYEYKFHIELKEKAVATRSGSDIEVVCVNENF